MLAGSEIERDASGPSYGIYAYTAREWDPEINLYYYRARYYDPKVGRFVSEDPTRFRSEWNFYRYVRNNPVTGIDPLGLYRCYYYIANHILVCEPEQPGNPWFVTDNMVSGKNGPQLIDPTRDISYSECTDCPNNPRRTNRSGRGPAPEGTYDIGPMQTARGDRRNLTPRRPTGRTHIQTHACSNPAECSEGCIAFTSMPEFNLFNDLMNAESGNTMTVRPGGGRHRR